MSPEWNLEKRETWKRIRSVGESWFFVEVSIIKPTDSLTDLFVALSSFPKLTNSLPESTVSFLWQGVTAIVCTFERESGTGQTSEENRGRFFNANTSIVEAFPRFWRQERKSSEGIEPGCVSQQISLTRCD